MNRRRNENIDRLDKFLKSLAALRRRSNVNKAIKHYIYGKKWTPRDFSLVFNISEENVKKRLAEIKELDKRKKMRAAARAGTNMGAMIQEPAARALAA